jgi:hypothetical protein
VQAGRCDPADHERLEQRERKGNGDDLAERHRMTDEVVAEGRAAWKRIGVATSPGWQDRINEALRNAAGK